MQQKKYYLRVWLAIIVIGIFNPLLVQAATSKQTTQVAISLVIDQSGSMEEFDPRNLRQSAAEILIDLMSPDDWIGVVRFSNDAKEVFPLQATSNTAKKNELKEKLKEPAENIGATDYLRALQLAVKQLEQAPADSQKVVLFLTDGYPEQSAVNGVLPIPEADYVNLIRNQIQTMGANGIPIYPIGFGASAEELLKEMALATKGEAAILNSPTQIADTFFDILATTKRRNPLAELDGVTVKEEEVVIPVDSNTQQVTVLITTNGQQLSVESRGNVPDGTLLQHYSGYSVLTVNQVNKGAGGDVRLFVKTDGTATVSGARDSFFRMTLNQPENNTVKSFGQPLDVEVALSSELEEGMELEAKILKNGETVEQKLNFEEEFGKYTASYDGLDELGAYEVQLSLMRGEEVISETSSSFTVKNIPALKSDMNFDKKVYKLGEEVAVNSFLSTQDAPVLESSDLQISNYQLIFQKERNDLNRIKMTADPTGVYTTTVKFDETGAFYTFIQVTGTYEGQSFIQELNLGYVEIGTVGTMEVVLLEDATTKDGKGTFKVPVQLTNHSPRDEFLKVSMAEAMGGVRQEEWLIPAGATMDGTIIVDLINRDVESAELFFQPKDTRMLVVEGPKRTVALTFEASFFQKILNVMRLDQFFLLVLAMLVFLFWLVGQLLYQQLVHRYKTIGDKIWYLAPSALPNDWKNIRSSGDGSTIRIAFGGAEGKVDLLLPALPDMGPGFLLTISKQLIYKERFRFIEGYKALFEKKPFVMRVRVTSPGYLEYRGQILKQLVLTEEDQFEIGGYQFLCQMEAIDALGKENQMA